MFYSSFSIKALIAATLAATPELQTKINTAVDAVVPNNPPGATGAT